LARVTARAFASADDAASALEQVGYLASREIATSIFLSDRMQKPVLVEGPAGVGKTELGRAMASALGRELIRLQCYEGLDEAKALYEWEYAKQLLYTQLLKDKIGESLQGAATIKEAADRIASSVLTHGSRCSTRAPRSLRGPMRRSRWAIRASSSMPPWRAARSTATQMRTGTSSSACRVPRP
jgi:hypothetical protein